VGRVGVTYTYKLSPRLRSSLGVVVSSRDLSSDDVNVQLEALLVQQIGALSHVSLGAINGTKGSSLSVALTHGAMVLKVPIVLVPNEFSAAATACTLAVVTVAGLWLRLRETAGWNGWWGNLVGGGGGGQGSESSAASGSRSRPHLVRAESQWDRLRRKRQEILDEKRTERVRLAEGQQSLMRSSASNVAKKEAALDGIVNFVLSVAGPRAAIQGLRRSDLLKTIASVASASLSSGKIRADQVQACPVIDEEVSGVASGGRRRRGGGNLGKSREHRRRHHHTMYRVTSGGEWTWTSYDGPTRLSFCSRPDASASSNVVVCDIAVRIRLNEEQHSRAHDALRSIAASSASGDLARRLGIDATATTDRGSVRTIVVPTSSAAARETPTRCNTSELGKMHLGVSTGLVIRRATYGAFEDVGTDEECRLDVTVPLQFYVSNSNLIVPGGSSKRHIFGFCDPRRSTVLASGKEIRAGGHLMLDVEYTFEGMLYHKRVRDEAPLILPTRTALAIGPAHAVRRGRGLLVT